ncbi:MAG: hypothetical protein HYY44_02790 [Deltaproteobacteria bacterium]|nr:hypothetical protein [Deltaproteobacteria bacterium]
MTGVAEKFYGRSYSEAIDLSELKKRHHPLYEKEERVQKDGNEAAAIASLQFWRSPIYAGFPITPSTKWLETIAAYVNSGHFVIEENGRKISTKRVKLLEAEHAVADYLAGAAAACRELIFMTATSSVGLDHMTETTRSLGASGLGNVMLINVYRATANYPLCIEGDPSDTLAHRDDGWIQVVCRGKQQIYDTLLQLPCIGMHPDILIPTMPGFYGIKDSHRSEPFFVLPDEKIHRFQDSLLPDRAPLPGLINGDTSMGNCVTSPYFQGFKWEQKQRLDRVFHVLKKTSDEFQREFGRPGIEPIETYFLEDAPPVILVAMGPDTTTAWEVIRKKRQEGQKIGLVVIRLLTPFPLSLVRGALGSAEAVGVVNNAFHTERGHLTALVSEAVNNLPIKTVGFFAGLGAADISTDSWEKMIRLTTTLKEGGSCFIYRGEAL